MWRGSRPPVFATFVALALALVATLGAQVHPPAQAATSPFTDIAGTTFEGDIDWLFAEGITVGCRPTLYCPNDAVTRGQMASFLVRMFDLPTTATDFFTDDEGSTHEGDINRLAAADITVGCTPTTFCPTAPVRRDAMASFLTRAIPLTAGAGDNYFRDDDGTTHEADIDRAAAAGITTGCGTWRYCIADLVTRGQMAGFLHRVEKPVSPPPHPAPGIATLYVATTGADGANPCLVEATPCRTIGHALGITLDGDTIEVSAGTYAEENLTLYHDVTIVGDPGGDTIIDASGGGRYRVITVPVGRTVSLAHLTLTGGRADNGGAILNLGTLTVSDSSISANKAARYGGGIHSAGDLTIDATTIDGNSAPSGWSTGGAGVNLSGGTTTITDSMIRQNAGDGIDGADDTLTITDSSIQGNTDSGIVLRDGDATITDATIAGNAQRGIVDVGGTLSITDTSIDGNTMEGVSSIGSVIVITHSTVSGNGGPGWGGIDLATGWSNVPAGTATITDSVIRENHGSGIASGGSFAVTLLRSTVSGNLGSGAFAQGNVTVADSTISDNGGSVGGGVYVHGGTVTIVNSTISSNTATERGGGIYGYIAYDISSVFALKNTIVLGNSSPDAADVGCFDNQDAPVACVGTTLASIVGIPAGLTLADILDPAGLADNGGPTKTIALTDSATNPAMDHGDAATCAAAPVSGLDQRGLPRTPPCDIGAYELQP